VYHRCFRKGVPPDYLRRLAEGAVRRMRSLSAKLVCRAMISIACRLCSISRRFDAQVLDCLAGNWPVSARSARLNWPRAQMCCFGELGERL
jgi:hypothetical protein